MIALLSPTHLTVGGLGLLLDLGVKASLLMILALIVHLALSQRRPLARSAMWNAAVLGLIVLPIVSAALPQWRIPVPERVRSVADDLKPEPVWPRQQIDSEPTVAVAEQAAMPLQDGAAAPPERPATVAEASRQQPEESSAEVVSSIGSSHEGTIATVCPWRGWHLLTWIYAVGVLVLAARLGGGLWAIHCLRRGAHRLGGDWQQACENQRRNLGITSAVEVTRSDEISVPVTIGRRWPVIIIPSRLADDLPVSHRDSVLLHELAHIQRDDYLWQLMYRIAQVIYWPHPLIWLCGRVMNHVREQTCDDWCLYHESQSGAYRSALMEVARVLVSRPGISLGVAMARSSNLGDRLKRLSHGAGTPACFAALPLGVGIAVLVLGMTTLLATAEIKPAEHTTAGVHPAESKQRSMKPRAVVSRLIALAAEGNEDAAGRWVGNDNRNLMVNMGMLTRFNDKIAIDRVEVSGPPAASRAETALVITNPVRNAPAVSPDAQERPLAFRLARDGSSWQIKSIRFESSERVDALVGQFLAESTGASARRAPGLVSTTRPAPGSQDAEGPKPGDIIIEAESYASRTRGAEMSWYEMRGKDGCFAEGPEIGEPGPALPDGARGDYMLATGTGVGYTPPIVRTYTGPVLKYRVRLDESGYYRLLVRWAGPNQDSDSFYAYIKTAGGGLLTRHSPHFFMYHVRHKGWQWRSNGLRDNTYSNAQGCPDRATWLIPKKGQYTICVAGREGGTAIDALILRRVGDAPKHDDTLTPHRLVPRTPNTRGSGPVAIRPSDLLELPAAGRRVTVDVPPGMIDWMRISGETLMTPHGIGGAKLTIGDRSIPVLGLRSDFVPHREERVILEGPWQVVDQEPTLTVRKWRSADGDVAQDAHE